MANTTFNGPVISTNGFVGSQVDSNGNEVIIEAGVASAVNEITVTNAATGNPPSIISSGGDTNVGLSLSAKGTGSVILWTGAGTREALILANTASAVNEVTITQAATGNAPLIAATGETNVGLGLSAKGTGSLTLWTGNAAREALILPNVASAVNEYTITQAATGTSPSIAATGGDTNISVKFIPKGTGQVVTTLGQFISFGAVPAEITTAGAATYTAEQLLAGLILRNPNGAGRADVTPTAALLVAAVPGCAVGNWFEFTLRNTAGAAETITLTAGTGVTISGTATVAQSNSKRWRVEFTNVTASSEAYTVYSLGTVTT